MDLSFSAWHNPSELKYTRISQDRILNLNQSLITYNQISFSVRVYQHSIHQLKLGWPLLDPITRVAPTALIF